MLLWTRAKTINANFNEGSGNTAGKYYDLTVTVSAGGTVATTDNKINCDSSNSPCKHSYGKNGTVTLKATSNSGYSFKDANISCSGNAKEALYHLQSENDEKPECENQFQSLGSN